MAEEKLLTTKEVADMLRTPHETVRYWRSAGKGPTWFKIGRRVLYAESDVLAFIASARAGRTGQGEGGNDGQR